MPEIHLDLLNLNSLLLILLIIIIGGYLYYEIYHLKSIINDLQYTLNKQMNFINSETELTSDIRHDLGSDLGPDLGNDLGQDLGMVIKLGKELGDEFGQNLGQEVAQNLEQDLGPVLGEELGKHDSCSSEEWGIRQQMDYNPDSELDNVIDSDSTQINSATIDDILSGKNIITDNTLSDILNVDDDLTKIDEFINTIKLSEDSKVILPDYSSMTVSQLKKVLSDEGLTVSGNKTKLIERIKENKL